MSDNAHSFFKHFDDMVWPNPKKLDALQWSLTHAPDSITREDKLLLASLMAAYKELIACPRKKREYVCSTLRKG